MVRQKVPEKFFGATYARLKSHSLQWPIQDDETKILHQQSFATEDELGNFIYNQYILRNQIQEILEDKLEDFYLTTGRVIEHYNNAKQTIECEKLEKRYDEDVLLVSNEDSFDENKRYILISKYGATAPLKIKKSKNIKKGTLFCTFHHHYSKINFLFGDESDVLVKTACFKSIKVKVKSNEQI
jgi:formate dehydrogenase major subunit